MCVFIYRTPSPLNPHCTILKSFVSQCFERCHDYHHNFSTTVYCNPYTSNCHIIQCLSDYCSSPSPPPLPPSQCWSGDGYNLWMLPTNSGSGLLPPATPLKPDQSDSSSDSDYPTTPSQLHRGRHGNNVLVMRFVKNTVVNNPTIVS